MEFVKSNDPAALGGNEFAIKKFDFEVDADETVIKTDGPLGSKLQEGPFNKAFKRWLSTTLEEQVQAIKSSLVDDANPDYVLRLPP
mmetsp:Transcript_47299/g.34590  ORF Transcript_47299/g.34590 Transcript_47299/m.34590 type:complete len:86 (+) Transcript_47299:396-653(+)